MKKLYLIMLVLLISKLLVSQDTDRKIDFPNVNGFLALKCDLHIHTVFSDGLVWPTIRLDEALKDGLDVIALTEHIEYQPWKADVMHKDRNRSYELIKEYAKPHDIMIVHGTEITRKMPPGHANAIFVQDVNKIMKDDALESYREARKQGAFIFWNHPHWINQQKDGIPVLSDFHKQLIREDLLHGMEVVNDLTYSEEGMKTAVANKLTVLGTSDIHGLIDYQFNIAMGGHRPITLVFAKEKSEASLKEALFAGRTVAWFNHLLVGKEENLKLLIDACLKFKNTGFIGDSQILEMEIENTSDATFTLQNTSAYTFQTDGDVIEVKPKSKKNIQIVTSSSQLSNANLVFKVLNAVSDYKKNISVSIPIN